MSDDFNAVARISYLTLKMGEQVDLLPKYTRLKKTDFRSINRVMQELKDFNINNIQNAKGETMYKRLEAKNELDDHKNNIESVTLAKLLTLELSHRVTEDHEKAIIMKILNVLYDELKELEKRIL